MIQQDVLPCEPNFADLDPVKNDDLGVPAARITISVYKNELRMAAYIGAKLAAIRKAAGATKTSTARILVAPVTSHAYCGGNAAPNLQVLAACLTAGELTLIVFGARSHKLPMPWAML